MNYEIRCETSPKPTDVQVLGDGIMAYAVQQKGHKPIEFFAFFIRGEDNEVLGGCNCAILYGCLYVDLLWVSESLRNKDYGTKLMLEAEKLGKDRGCTFGAVNTMDWEALGFYKKLGYEVEFERHGFEKNSVFYFLCKAFVN
jgi:ribosomal protein S18 acetylase RimI-like enzyme